MNGSESSIQRFGTNQRMSKVVVHQNTAYICGQVGNPGESIEAQTLEALHRVEQLLMSVGSDRSKLLHVTVWLSDMKYFDAMNLVWEGWLPQGAAPSRACGEAKLARDTLFVEFICTAAC